MITPEKQLRKAKLVTVHAYVPESTASLRAKHKTDSIHAHNRNKAKQSLASTPRAEYA